MKPTTIAIRFELSDDLLGQDEGPEERPANFQYVERIGEEAAEIPTCPMIEVLGGVSEVFKVFQPQHVAEAPPGLVGNACKEVTAADSGHFDERGLRIPQVFEHFHHEHQIERLCREGEAMDIAGGQPAATDHGLRLIHAGKINVHPVVGRASQAAEDYSFAAARIQDGFCSDQSYHVVNRTYEAPVGVLRQRTGIRVFCLSRGQIRRRFGWS